MTSFRNIPCWEIMKCSGTEDCPARKEPDALCWEIAEKLGTSQSYMDICRDCIVYVVKTDNSILSQKEIDAIMKHRNLGKPVTQCPAYTHRDNIKEAGL